MEENKMGVMPIDKLIISMSLPIMISMLVQALYNIVDSIFVAMISENALTAVSMAFPIQNLMIAVGVGTAVGVNALLARSLGEKDTEKVNKVAENAVFLILVSYLLFLIIGLFFAEPFFRSQTDIEEIIVYGKQYLTICCCLSFGIFTQLMFERMLQATGKTIYTMYTQGVGAIINIALDPVFIFGLFGLPKMGISGAAAATVIGQMIAGILIAFSSTATAVFGVYFKLQSFVFMPAFGLNNGVIPVMAYNYGAGNKERVTKTLKHCVAYAVGIMAVGLLLFQLFPKQLLSMFQASDTMLSIGVPALRIISLSFLLAGFGISCSSIFQALGKAVYSMCISIARQLVILLPAAYLLAQSGNVNLVWWAFPIAELVSVCATAFFLMKINRSIVSKIGQ